MTISSIRGLYEAFVVDKKTGKELAGPAILSEQILSEEAASFVTADAFNIITSQIFFNALTTKYNGADFNVKGLFKKIPSNLPFGEKFGGVSNMDTVLRPVAFTDELPTIKPSQDFSESPAQERKGAIVNIGMDLVRADATGQVMQLFEKMGSIMGLNDELEACATLANVDFNSTTGATYARTHYKWKNIFYDTYYQGPVSPTVPWANLNETNPLTDWNNLNTAWTSIAATLDPFTGWPIDTSGKWYLIVPTPLAFTASRIKRSTQFRTGTASSNNSILITQGADGGGLPVEFEIVVSKYLHQILKNNTAGTGETDAASTAWWFFGIPGDAFSFQTMIDVTTSQAVENAGFMFTRSLAASYKVERCKTAYVFNPRLMTCNTPSTSAPG